MGMGGVFLRREFWEEMRRYEWVHPVQNQMPIYPKSGAALHERRVIARHLLPLRFRKEKRLSLIKG
ncbi:hypothetical protein MCP1_200065 [Candidatus Terasakiella magnetica]|nr:hypothetical protein MCP1_200065 [Candidatus Terasakiella magnetica]